MREGEKEGGSEREKRERNRESESKRERERARDNLCCGTNSQGEGKKIQHHYVTHLTNGVVTRNVIRDVDHSDLHRHGNASV